MIHTHQIFDKLLQAYGAQHWWPGDSAFEICLGAILTQNTAWKNVESALSNLRESGCLSVEALRKIHRTELEELIRPAGYFRQKAKRLVTFADFLHEEYQGRIEGLFQSGLPAAREALLRLNGIGPETADSILLYAGHLPTFVVDTYTARILKRHGWIEPEADYYELQSWFVDSLPEDVALFNEFHALIVNVGKNHCRRTPRCDGCPLQDCLPPDGQPLMR